MTSPSGRFSLALMEDSKLRKYATLFSSVFMISAFTFGGGFVIVPLMKRKFVDDLGWLGEEEMLDLTAIAQSSPGAIAVNASILVGYKTLGIPGALTAILGTIIPPFVIISVISMFYVAFRDNRFVSMAMAGMLAGVAAVVTDVVITMAASILKEKRLIPVLVLIAAFIALRIFNVSIILIILIAGAIGYITSRRKA